MGLKKQVRKRLTRQQRLGIKHLRQRKLKAAAGSFIADVGTRLVNRTPSVNRIIAQESLNVVERLDYPGSEIYLVCQSHLDLKRCRGCSKEPETIEWIESFIEPGDVLYDVGANVGAYSLVASKFTQGRATIYAFEPSVLTFVQLSKNIMLNHCQQSVTPFQVALSDHTGIHYLAYSRMVSGAASHQLLERLDDQADFDGCHNVQPILSYSLDDFVKQFQLPVPTHIKLDVDGGEYKVLVGAAEIFSRPGVRSVLVEIDQSREDSMKTIEYLESKAFRLHARQRHGASSIWNYVFVKDTRLNQPLADRPYE